MIMQSCTGKVEAWIKFHREGFPGIASVGFPTDSKRGQAMDQTAQQLLNRAANIRAMMNYWKRKGNDAAYWNWVDQLRYVKGLIICHAQKLRRFANHKPQSKVAGIVMQSVKRLEHELTW